MAPARRRTAIAHRPAQASGTRADWLDVGYSCIGPIALVIALAASPGPADSEGPSDVERDVVWLLNCAREAAGLAPLRVHPDLVRAARAQTLRMATAGRLFHTERDALHAVIPWWTRLAENVALGPSVERIHATFLASPPHAANVFGDFDFVGVGADRDPGDTLYVTLIFARVANGDVVNTTEGGRAGSADTTTAAWGVPPLRSPSAPRPAPR